MDQNAINKVLYNVDQTSNTTTDDRAVARKNIGLDLDTAWKRGEADGLATLDSNGLVPAEQLPSYVDDVIEGYYYNGAFYKESAHTTTITPELGKIYVDLTTGANSATYRYSGNAYVQISAQNTFSTISVQTGASTRTDVTATSVMDTYNIDAGSGVTLAVSSKTITVGHTNSVTSGTIGTSSATSGNATLDIPYATFDSEGHITGKGTHTHTIGTANASALGLIKLTDSISGKETAASGGLAVTPKGVDDAITTAITTHVHGYILNGGTFSSESGSSATIGTGDTMLIVDSSDSSKIKKTDISFDTTSSNSSKYLAKTGSWVDLPTYGNILTGGNFSTASGSSVSLATGDALVIVDSSDSSKIKKTSITFDTTSSNSNKYLSQTGSWTSLPSYSAGTDLKLTGTTFSVDTNGAAAGTMAFVAGSGTSAAADYSFVGGINSASTSAGTGSFVWGTGNSSASIYATVLGDSNSATDAPVALIAGQRNTISSGNASVIALGNDLKLTTASVQMVFGRANADNNQMGGIDSNATLARITGWGTYDGSAVKTRKNIEWLSDTGLLETASGFQTRLHEEISSGSSTIYSHSDIILRNDYTMTQYGETIHYPQLTLIDTGTKRTSGGLDDSTKHTVTCTPTELLINYEHTDDLNNTSAEYTKYSSHYIEFESSTNGSAHFSLGTLAVPAWSTSMGNTANAVRVRLGTGHDSNLQLANLVLSTISVRTLWAGDLTAQHPLYPSEQEGEITIVTAQSPTSSSTVTSFWYCDATHTTAVEKSGYISSGTACMLVTVYPSTNLGKTGQSLGWFQKIA